jgi:hypothetical protein
MGSSRRADGKEGAPSMDPRNAAQRDQPDASEPGEPQAIDFVRFCYRRRRVGWPELYDEMCAVAGRGLYHGFGTDELSGLGIGLSLFEMPALAALVQRVVAEDATRRRLSVQAVRPSAAGGPSTTHDEPVEADSQDRFRTFVAVPTGA